MESHEIKILYVEDNPNDIELTLHAFKKNKLINEVEIVRDGQEALDFIFGNGDRKPAPKKPRVILLDLKLPKVDGMEVLRRIKGDPRTKTIPVIVLTSSKEEQDIIDSYQLGVNSYIVKPVDFDKFVQAMKTLEVYWLLLNEPPPL